MIIEEQVSRAISPDPNAAAIQAAIQDDVGNPSMWNYGRYLGHDLWEIITTYNVEGDDLPEVGDWTAWPVLEVEGRDGKQYKVRPVLMQCGKHRLNCYQLEV